MTPLHKKILEKAQLGVEDLNRCMTVRGHDMDAASRKKEKLEFK